MTELRLRDASLATVAELFRYKQSGFTLPPFPGFTDDQWGIKAHNRPWIEEVGDFSAGQRILEVGGAYTRLPEFLGEKYGVEPWIADDFGVGEGEELWSRWGDPAELPQRHPGVNYVFERFGRYSSTFADSSFDRIFSVSTLEHIPFEQRLDVLRDIHRCLAPRGLELHSIDIPVRTPLKVVAQAVGSAIKPIRMIAPRLQSDIRLWFDLFRQSGVEMSRPPSSLKLLDRRVLVESPDVVYRYMPPVDAPKDYVPAASLLLTIERLT